MKKLINLLYNFFQSRKHNKSTLLDEKESNNILFIKEKEKHTDLVHSLRETQGSSWELIKYPNNKNREAIYYCSAHHVFEMTPSNFSQQQECNICKMYKNISRSNQKYNTFLAKAKRVNHGRCELTNNKEIAVHHLYSIRMYPDLAYDSRNAILLSKKLHKEYHRFFLPHETNAYTFLYWLSWLRNQDIHIVSTQNIEQLIIKVKSIMSELEVEIFKNRSEENTVKQPVEIDKITYDKQKFKIINGKIEKITKGQRSIIEIKKDEIYTFDESGVIYRNDYGNWFEFTPINKGILINVLHELDKF